MNKLTANETAYEYGKFCTVAGKRYMIVDWTKNYVIVHDENGRRKFHQSVVTEVTDYLEPTK